MAKRTSRANSIELKKIKLKLISVYGLICQICNHPMPVEKLIIEHIDNDYTNWNEDNLQLACQSCNINKNPPYLIKKDIDFSHSLTPDLQPKPQSSEMERNIKSEPLFREWLKKEMTKKLSLELEHVINSGAEVAEVSTYTVRNNYLRKLTSEAGLIKLSLLSVLKQFTGKKRVSLSTTL